MKFLARIFGLVFLVSLWAMFAPLALAQTTAEPVGTVETHRFKLEDYRRRYKLYTPANAAQLRGPRPLVLVIHGGGGTDRHMIKMDKGRWNQLADQHGFYVAYPNAVDKLWDFGEGKTSEDLDNRVDDLAYFGRVMDDISRRKNIDQSRIFATGISRGGQSSYFLACNMPERIRAVMPVAMAVPEFMVDNCVSGPPVGIAIMNGTADPQVPYEGGPITVFRKTRDVVLSADETVALWRTRNGCPALPVTSSIDKPGDKTSVDIKDWPKCFGAPVKFYSVKNGGHTWPSGLQYLPPRIVGETSKDISAAEEGWAFFSGF